jgi:hypothetical protein
LIITVGGSKYHGSSIYPTEGFNFQYGVQYTMDKY